MGAHRARQRRVGCLEIEPGRLVLDLRGGREGGKEGGRVSEEEKKYEKK